MRYLVDSDWIADYLVGKQEAVALLDRLVSDGIAVSLISVSDGRPVVFQQARPFYENRQVSH